MGQDARETLSEIEQTREELAHKVDALVDQAKVEAAELGKKLAIGAIALAGVLVLGIVAKRLVRS
ncbi:MAG: DUF3618 domain-containing protein [Actinomycetota bacterium]|nr:DUF3618 domain-containing protein [Actinomycetota bacterium]